MLVLVWVSGGTPPVVASSRCHYIFKSAFLSDGLAHVPLTPSCLLEKIDSGISSFQKAHFKRGESLPNLPHHGFSHCSAGYLL